LRLVKVVGQGLHVGDHHKGVELALKLGNLPQHAKVMADVQTAGWTNAG